MKIYDRLVIDIDSGVILEEISYEYDGPVALCGGGSSAPAPAQKTAAENALDEEQLAMMREQRAAQKEMEPFQLEAMGYYRDENGKIQKLDKGDTPDQILAKKNLALLGYSSTGEKLTEDQIKESMTDSERTDYEINKLSKQRQLDALQGNLAVSPALEAELAAEQNQAEEVLARKLGPNWMLSTPGIEAMKNLRQKASLLREESRRGLITTNEGLLQSQYAQEQMRQNANINTANMFTNNANNKISQMMGYSSGQLQGMDASTTLSSKYASERANQQNLAMQGYVARTNASTSTTNAAIGGTAMVGAAAAAAAAQ